MSKSEIEIKGLRDRLEKLIGDEKPFTWAAMVGIPGATFTRMWKEGTAPKAETLLKIHKATETSIDWLLTGEGPMHRDDAPAADGDGVLDQEVLQSAIETVEEILEITGKKVTSTEKARAIVIVYEYFMEDDHTVKDTGKVLRLLKNAI